LDMQFAGYKKLRTPNNLKQIHTEHYASLIADLCLTSRILIEKECEELPLKSLVSGKEYFAYRRTTTSSTNLQTVRTSRPINKALYIRNNEEFASLIECFLQSNYEILSADTITQLLYTIAMSFCVANDVHKTGDKKTPATFFELFVAHLFARQFQAFPRKKIKVPSVENQNAELPTDIIFDLGMGKVKFHVPVKLSTRERVIQAWAHQRVLEGLWGTAEFKGLLIVLTETKLNLDKLEVVEICLPLQWAVYQRYIAHLDRVYYLDIPERYADLASTNPRIDVKPLGVFFGEKDILLAR
jgi:hypothetical protein